MGLDMYALTIRRRPETPVDFELHEKAADLHYWRKHPNLHGWMERLYREKGGADPNFNVVPVVLTSEDLDRLEADVRAQRLPPTSGFFFGASCGDEQDDDLRFIADAREALAAGLTVIYTAWW